MHSLKDVPTVFAKGLHLAAVPARGNSTDSLIFKKENPFENNRISYTVATSSLRRKAQWLRRFPNHTVIPIRGNVNSRIQKLMESDEIDATILATAGIERLNLQVPNRVSIPQILPAPSQGALGIMCRVQDDNTTQLCQQLNDTLTYQSTSIERDFLRYLNGGCTMPIAARASFLDGEWHVQGNILSLDGMEQASVEISNQDWTSLGEQAAKQLLNNGGLPIHQDLMNGGDL